MNCLEHSICISLRQWQMAAHCLCHSEFRIESMEESNIRGTENWTWTNRYYTLKAKAGSFKFYISRHILYNPLPYNLKKKFSLGFYIYSVRDHPHVTSVKDWVGRSRKWPVLLTFSFVFNFIHNKQTLPSLLPKHVNRIWITPLM